MDWELLLVLTHLSLSGLVSPERSDPLRRLRPLRQEYFRPDLPIAFAFGPRLLLALRPISTLGKADGGLVKLGLAPVRGLPDMYLVVFMGRLGIVLLREE